MKVFLAIENNIKNFSAIDDVIFDNKKYLFGSHDKLVYLIFDNEFKLLVRCDTEPDRIFNISQKDEAEEYYDKIRFIKSNDLKSFIKKDMQINIIYFIDFNEYTTIKIASTIEYGEERYFWYLYSPKLWVRNCLTERDNNTIKSFDTIQKCKNSLIRFLNI